MLRTDLDVPMTSYVALPPLEEEFRELLAMQEEEAQQNQRKKVKKTKKQLDEEAEMVARYEAGKLARQEPWKSRQILDHKLLQRASATIKLLQEKQAKRVTVLSSLGEKCGRVKLENSVRAILPSLQQKLPDIQLAYLDAESINNSAAIVDELKEGIFYVAENLNFRPDEHSYVEPWVEPEDTSKPKEEERKEAAPVVDLKKMSAAEKKKYEEEQKKKEDELAKSQTKTSAEIEREEQLKLKKEEEAARRAEEEYFDYKTTNRLLQNLQNFGSVYVNDAPLASLSTSNTVSDVKFRTHVMGVKVTEDIRKLAQFFMKPFPLDVKLRHVKRPEDRPYFQTKAAAIIGGLCKTSADLLDKILLIN